jgi:NDP-sugar pyrophosphorylase family protein
MTGPGPVPQTVLIAGGRGTRLAAVTAGAPKVLVNIAGRPLLDWVLALLAELGVTSVHLCLGHGAEQVLAHLAATPQPVPTITSTVERAPQGTAGCLRLAAPYLEPEFAVLLGDTYTPVDFVRLATRWRESRAAAGMVVLRNEDRLVPSNVDVAGDRVVRYDKTAGPGALTYVDFGIAFFRRVVVSRIAPTGAVDLGTLFQDLIRDGGLAALPVTERFYEIGSPAGHAELCRLADEGRIRVPAAVPTHPGPVG